MAMLNLELRRYRLTTADNGWLQWQAHHEKRSISASRTAIVVCDMWDNHWSRGAAERVNALAPKMNAVLQAARTSGAHIIHAPSDTLAYYADSAARRRMLSLPDVALPQPVNHPDPPLPVDAADGGSDTGETETFRAWRRQHPALEIDERHDGISDSGEEIYRYIQEHGVALTFIMGVHTNMCILNRSFGIKQMVRWCVPIVLVRDLTDAMYNPGMAPYVSHREGTQLVIGYIERFWCPTVDSQQLLSDREIVGL